MHDDTKQYLIGFFLGVAAAVISSSMALAYYAPIPRPRPVRVEVVREGCPQFVQVPLETHAEHPRPSDHIPELGRVHGAPRCRSLVDGMPMESCRQGDPLCVCR